MWRRRQLYRIEVRTGSDWKILETAKTLADAREAVAYWLDELDRLAYEPDRTHPLKLAVSKARAQKLALDETLGRFRITLP